MLNQYRNTTTDRFWNELNIRGESTIKTCFDYPTERNQCFALGYVRALYDASQISEQCCHFFMSELALLTDNTK